MSDEADLYDSVTERIKRLRDRELAREAQELHEKRPRPSVPTGDPAPFVSGSTTSLEASISISPNVNTLRAKVLEALRARPMTDEEGAILLVMNPSTYRPRRVELAQLGLIKKAGVRKTAAKRNAQIWEAV